jgi:hypothetical protein
MPPAQAASQPHPAPPPAAAAAGPDPPPPPPPSPLAAAAVLPHPPLLVPELAGGAAAELDPLRAACRQALAAVLAAAEVVVLVGDGPAWGVPDPGAPGSFRPYGADVEVTLPAPLDLDLDGLPEPTPLSRLPLSLAVAAHLLAGLDVPSAHVFAGTVPTSLGPRAAAAVGRTLVATAAGRSVGQGRVGVVVMGDLSACRTERAPGALHPEAAGFDAAVAEALRSGRPEPLLDLDPTLAAELQVAGRVPLQVLAGALQQGPAMHGRILYDDAPYGVGYLVAVLTPP